MSNEVTKKIKAREEELGRSVSATERLTIARSIPSKDDASERMELVLTETMEGIQCLNSFHEEVEKANLVNNRHMRHVAAIAFEATKRDLLQRFNAGEIERIKPAA